MTEADLTTIPAGDHNPDESGVAAVDQAARQALQLLGYDDVANLIESIDEIDHDVVIVGAGQTGVATAYALRRSGVTNVSIIDQAADESDGAWRTRARNLTLRTPKTLAGPELGVPQLSFRVWYEGRNGTGSFDHIGRIETVDWADYLDWFRRQVGIEARYGVRLNSIEALDGGGLRLHLSEVRAFDGAHNSSNTTSAEQRSWTETTRKLVLATGVSGTGGPLIPEVVTGLSSEVFAHTADDIDFAALAGRSVAVLGAAASAFDAAAVALENGAREVSVYTRRSELVVQPTVGGPRPNRLAQDVFHRRADDTRWRQRKETLTKGASVPADSVERVAVFDNYTLHVDAAWRSAHEKDGKVIVVADDGERTFDFVIAGTGYQQNPATRPELESIAEHIALWGDRYTPAEGEESDTLPVAPYLGAGYQLTERNPGGAPWVADIHVFSIGANVSFGLPVGDVPSLPTGIPRLAQAVAHDLVLADLDRAASNSHAGSK